MIAGIFDMDPAFWIKLAFVSLLGLILGSFATALIHRIPAGIPWSFKSFKKNDEDGQPPMPVPRSSCPHCHAVLQVRDLVPLFSWIANGGRCRFCKAPIGWMYPAVEVLTACGCVAIFFGWGLHALSVIAMLTVPFLVALAVIDFKHLILPNEINIILVCLWPLLVVVALFQGYGGDAVFRYATSGLVGAMVFPLLAFLAGTLIKAVLKKEAIGFGDVKFFAVAGLWLGITLLVPFLLLAGVFGVIMGIIYRVAIKEAYFPFGPALICAFYILILFARPGFMY